MLSSAEECLNSNHSYTSARVSLLQGTRDTRGNGGSLYLESTGKSQCCWLLPQRFQRQVGYGSAGSQIKVPEFRAELTEAGTRTAREHTRHTHAIDLFPVIYISYDMHYIIYRTNKPGLPLKKGTVNITWCTQKRGWQGKQRKGFYLRICDLGTAV